MKFLYRASVSPTPDGDDYLLFLRPAIPITIVGLSAAGLYSGLVDTGSDNTILPRSIADDLGISLQEAEGPPASVFGGTRVKLLVGTATFQIQVDDETIEWRTEVCFFDFPSRDDETVILGHDGFLDFFTATFDGKLGTLTLVANDDLPAV